MIGHNHIGRNGRFGNQMFQYAATKGIAANRGYEYCIPPGPKDEYDFEDEENQHKLFMAFKLSGLNLLKYFLQSIERKVDLILIRICLITVRMM